MIGHQNFQNGGNYPAYMNPAIQQNYPQQSFQMNQVQPQQPPIQYSSIVLVRSEEEARNYPIGLGTSIPFKNEMEPYMYTKTMGFNQLGQPEFKRYKLIEEADPEPEKEPDPEVLELRRQIDELRDLIKSNISKSPSNKRTKEDVTND